MSGYFVIIRRLKSYKYGEAMLAPVGVDGQCHAAIDHGTVVELRARSIEAGRKLLGVFREPFDGYELWAQGRRFAELITLSASAPAGSFVPDDWNITRDVGSPEEGNRERGHDPLWRWVPILHFLSLPIPE